MGMGRRRPPAPLFAALGLVVVLGFAYATWTVWSNDRALQSRGENATATVVEVGTGRGRRIHVQFHTPDGRLVRAQVGQGDEPPGPRPAVGEQVPIVYDPHKPESAVRDTRAPENHTIAYLLAGTTLFGAIGIPLATVGLVRANRRGRG